MRVSILLVLHARYRYSILDWSCFMETYHISSMIQHAEKLSKKDTQFLSVHVQFQGRLDRNEEFRSLASSHRVVYNCVGNFAQTEKKCILFWFVPWTAFANIPRSSQKKHVCLCQTSTSFQSILTRSIHKQPPPWNHVSPISWIRGPIYKLPSDASSKKELVSHSGESIILPFKHKIPSGVKTTKILHQSISPIQTFWCHVFFKILTCYPYGKKKKHTRGLKGSL